MTHGTRQLLLERPVIMGVLNVTPDSFSDGGQFLSLDLALKQARRLIEEGAHIIDVGGESTGPGSVDVSLEEEWSRVVPVIRGILREFPEIWVSVDTWKSEVARAAIEAGADLVNDVTALRGDPRMAQLVAEKRVPVVLMYSKDSTPRTTREPVEYEDVVQTISAFWEERVSFALEHGIERGQLILDPGMGAFVSALSKYSFEILRRLNELTRPELPLLVAASRKGFLKEVCGGGGPEDRMEGSLAAAMIAALNGVSILRVHEVKETKRVLKFVEALIS